MIRMVETNRVAASYKSRAMAATFWRGWQAAMDGKSATICPYKDVRSVLGHVTFSRAFRRAWTAGHARGVVDASKGGVR